MHEINNEIGQNSLGGPLRGVGWAVALFKISTISDFGDICSKYVNLQKIYNANNQNNVASHVRELSGVTAPKPLQSKIQIFPILVKFGQYM